MPDFISPYLFGYGWTLVLSGLLLLFYRIFLSGRQAYRFQRTYLLAIPVVSLLGLLLQGGCHLYEQYVPAKQIYLSPEEALLYQETHPDAQIFPASVADFPSTEPVLSSWWTAWPWEQWLPLGILLVSMLLVVIALFQMLQIFLRTRRMKSEVLKEGYRLVRSEDVKTPFSFGTTIFMPQGREATNEEVLLRHEKAHVCCRHYADVWTIELLVRLMWFNPLLWLVRSTLRHLHEFEADRFVLDSGVDKLAYQTLLLEELMENSSVVTNGFNHSFVRRRFQEMRQTAPVSLSRWGRVAALSWIALLCGVFVAYGLSLQRPITIHIKTALTSEAEQRVPTPQQGLHAEGLSQDAESQGKAQEAEEGSRDALDELQQQPASIKENAAVRPTHAEDGWPILYELPLAKNQGEEDMRLVRREGETLLTFVHTETQDGHLYRFGGPDSYIVDPATGVHYQARRTIPAAAWHYFHLSGMKGKTWQVTVVFPPLPEDMKQVSLYQVTHHLQSGHVYNISSIEHKE